jgi:hypothetical protein
MAAVKNMAGQRIGRLTVLRRAEAPGRGKHPFAMWLCRCDCGTETMVRGAHLRSGHTLSCGCYGRETGFSSATHGHLRGYRTTPEYRAWVAALARCYRTEHDSYRWYGGKGVRVCNRWRDDFAAFLADMGLKPAPHLILCRKDKDGDYEPENCEWSIASPKVGGRVGGPLRRPQGRRRRVNSRTGAPRPARSADIRPV